MVRHVSEQVPRREGSGNLSTAAQRAAAEAKFENVSLAALSSALDCDQPEELQNAISEMEVRDSEIDLIPRYSNQKGS